MSEPRKPPAPARPGLPNAPKPNIAGSPKPPQVGPGAIRGRMPSSPLVAPPPPPAKSDEKDLPSDSAWDTAETVTNLPSEAAAAMPAPAPTPKGGVVAPVSSAPSPPQPIPTPTPSPMAVTKGKSVPPPAASTSPGPSLQGLSAPQREEVWAIVRAAVSEATAPMLSKQRELEERLRLAEQAAANAANAAARAPMPSIPVTGLSIPPEGARSPQKFRLSVPPGVYGVAVIDAGEQKPAVDLTNVGPIHDMPDFGGRSRHVSKVVAAVIILVVAGALISMIASRS